MNKKVTSENPQEQKLQARIESDDTLREQNREAEKVSRDRIRVARDRYD